MGPTRRARARGLDRIAARGRLTRWVIAGGALVGLAAIVAVVSCGSPIHLVSVDFYSDAGRIADGPGSTVTDAGADVPLPVGDGLAEVDALPAEAAPVVCPSLAVAPEGYARLPTVGLAAGTVGGASGEVVVVTNQADLTYYAGQTVPLVIRIATNIVATPGSAAVKVTSDKTIEGMSAGAGLTGLGLWVNEASNVIIRQLVIQKVPHDQGDCVTIQHSNHVWVDHCDFFSDRLQPSDAGVYDDLVDVVHASDAVTISWNNLHDNWHPSLVGHTASDAGAAEDTGHLTVTYHHNYFHEAGSYNPRVRFGTVHVYNNVLRNIDNGIESQMNALVLIEGNVFADVRIPITTTYEDPIQGKVAVATTNRFLPDSGQSDIDASVAWDPQHQLPVGYAYVADSVDVVAPQVMKCAGPRW